MIVERGISLAGIVARERWSVAAAFLMAALVVILNDYTSLRLDLLSEPTVGIIIGALSIFLAFRVSEAYGRWWEARSLWGALLNDSRSFARQVLTLIRGEGLIRGDGLERGDGASDLQRALVRGQIAYVNALRMLLRREASWGELAPWLPEGELDELRSQPNVPQAILLRQAERLAGARERDWTSEFRWVALDGTLRRLTDHQGGCERIKNTVFPYAITVFTAWLVRGLILVVPLVLVAGDDSGDWVQALEAALISSSFVLMERLGHELKTPFEGAANDTAMSSICRTAERDLLAMLDERDLPPPTAPVDGVLL